MQIIKFTAHFEDASQIKAIKAVLKAFKNKFSISKTNIAYDTEFVAMIKKGEKEIEEGKGEKMSIEEFKLLCK